MNESRYGHTATLLPGNKVLVVGGYNGSNELASTETFDAATMTWTTTPSMHTARYNHSATLLLDGRILVAGGHNSNTDLAGAEIYNPMTNAWSSAASMATPRYLHTATLLEDGRVLVAGGLNENGATNTAEVYNPISNTWSPVATMVSPRVGHRAVLLSDGKVLMIGGDNGSTVVATAEIFNPMSNSWTSASSMHSSRVFHAAMKLANGQVLVSGGTGVTDNFTQAEIYDPNTNSWLPAGYMNSNRNGHILVLMLDDRALAAGGFDGRGPSAQTELKYPAVDSWVTAAPLSSQRVNHTATLLADGKILVVGGINEFNTSIATAELYTYSIPVDQTITFPPLADKYLGDGSFVVAATASSGLPVAFSATGGCSVTGNVVQLVQAGTCSMTASQTGSADTYPAPSVTRSFTISVAPVTGDTVAPDTSIISGPSGAIAGNSVTISWTGTDDSTPTSTLNYAYRLEPIEANFSEFSSATSKTYVKLANGAYTFYVKARDSALNEDPTPATSAFSVNVSATGLVILHCSVGSLQEAANEAQTGDTISVSGQCQENILIRNEKQRLMIDGNGSATVVGATATSPVFNVRGKGITIQGFTITGGSDGIVVNRGASAVINNNVISNAIGNGIAVEQLSFAAITNNTIHNNSQAGIEVADQSTARIGFNSDTETAASVNLIENNGVGVVVSNGSSTRIIGNTIASNSGDGIEVLRHSHADIADNIIDSNGDDGIEVSENSVVQLGEDTGSDIFSLSNTTTATNMGFAVKCGAGSLADGRLGSLTGTAGAKSFAPNCFDSLIP